MSELVSFNQEVATIPANPASDTSPESMLMLAISKGMSVECLDRLMAMAATIRAQQAKAAFTRAMAAFQSECPVVEKKKEVLNKDGKTVRYRYAPLDDVISVAQPLLAKNGLFYRFVTKIDANKMTVFCVVSHASGHEQTDDGFIVPIMNTGHMTGAQEVASASSFAKRHAFCNSLGVTVGQEDDDGESVTPVPPQKAPNGSNGQQKPTNGTNGTNGHAPQNNRPQPQQPSKGTQTAPPNGEHANKPAEPTLADRLANGLRAVNNAATIEEIESFVQRLKKYNFTEAQQSMLTDAVNARKQSLASAQTQNVDEIPF